MGKHKKRHRQHRKRSARHVQLADIVHQSNADRFLDEEAQRQAAKDFQKAELEGAAGLPLAFVKNLDYHASSEQIADVFAPFGVDRQRIFQVGRIHTLNRNSGMVRVLFPDHASLNRCLDVAPLMLNRRPVKIAAAPLKKGELVDHRPFKVVAPAHRFSLGSWEGQLSTSNYLELWTPAISDAVEVSLSPMMRMLGVTFSEVGRCPWRLFLKVGTIVGHAHLSQSAPDEFVLTISFSRPPFVSQQKTASSTNDFDHLIHLMIMLSMQASWQRTSDLPALAHCNAMQLCFRQKRPQDHMDKLLKTLARFHVRPGGREAVLPWPAISCSSTALPNTDWQQRDLRLGFRILCALDRLRSSTLGVHCEMNIVQPLLSALHAINDGASTAPEITAMLTLRHQDRVDVLSLAVEDLVSMISPIGNRILLTHTSSNIVDWLHEQIAIHLQAVNFPVNEEGTDNLNGTQVFMRRLMITPTRILFRAREAESANRAIRTVATMIAQPLHKVQDLFIRVSFTDENMSPFFNANASGDTDYDSVEPLYAHVAAVLRDGVLVGGRRYRFLGWSNAMIKEHAVWMMADPAEAGLSTSSISPVQLRSELGDFSEIHVVAKWAARLAQCFSSTVVTEAAMPKNIKYIADIDVTTYGKTYTFSDGVGTISAERARMMFSLYKRNLGKGRVAGSSGLQPPQLPSAFQIRIAGAKGMLSIDSRLTGLDVCLRPSMKKFESKDSTIEICKVARRGPYFLNRQIITLLNTLGISDRAVMTLLENDLRLLTRAAEDSTVARELLVCGNFSASGGITSHDLLQVIAAGFDVSSEPFLHGLLKAILVSRLYDLRYKARILVPRGAVLMGVLDEYGLLQHGEVFFCLSSECFDSRLADGNNGVGSFPTTATQVMVTRCPCFHPGDIRFLTAVTLPMLVERASRRGMNVADAERYYAMLKNVLLFPQHGPRPHTNEMSGGDLDGDEYFVTWESSIFPPVHRQSTEAMDFSSSAQPEKKDIVTEQDIQSFFVQFMKSDNLGIIATRHLALADQSDAMALDPRCLRLAQLHSTAVDFQKTGVPASLVDTLDLRVQKAPDFMESKGKNSYESDKILGQVYRRVLQAGELSRNVNYSRSRDQPILQDRELAIAGREDYFDEAVHVHEDYCHDLSVLMHKFGIKHEAEVFSGHVARFHDKAYARKKPHEAREILVREMRTLRRRYRQDLFGQVVDEHFDNVDIEYDELSSNQRGEVAKIVSAYYAVAYNRAQDDRTPSSLRFLSLPWIFPDVLADIKQLGQRRQDDCTA